MAFITGDIKHILSINFKKRYDDLPDQYNRLFMIKILIISSLIIGFDYFNDSVSCIMPPDTRLTPAFVSSTCWIQGFYVYDDLATDVITNGYYGVPKNLQHDGLLGHSGKSRYDLCQVGISKYCYEMKRTYYVQYQYMTFYTASLTILFYFPYILFLWSNSDVIVLRKYLNSGKCDADFVFCNFFSNADAKRNRMRVRVAMNVVVKVLYLIVNVVSFLSTDFILGGKFKVYGIKWVTWANNNRKEPGDNNVPNLPKPGNWLLPSMGICEIHEATEDASMTFTNKSRLVCELSPHILYQYCFLVLWFIMLLGLLVSCIGLIALFISYVSTYLKFCHYIKIFRRKLTFRELEYLEYVKEKNDFLFRKIVVMLNNGGGKPLVTINDDDGLRSLNE